jgi:adenine deaminase
MEFRQELIKVAQGQLAADLVVKGGMLANVNTREVYLTDVAVQRDRIAYVGNVEHCIGSETEVIDAHGSFLVPGLIETHMHTESAGVTLTQLARILLPRGVTTVVYAHEIANVLGLRGMQLIREESRSIPLKVLITTATEVPYYEGLETAGAHITVEDVREMLSWSETVALGEPDIFNILAGQEAILAKFSATREFGKRINGHAGGSPIPEPHLNALVAAGLDDCHEHWVPGEVRRKLRLGMKALLREADLEHIVPELLDDSVDLHHCMLCIDDKLVNTLAKEGGVDNTVRKAISYGLDPMTVLQMATVNAASHYRRDHEVGSITPGRFADLFLTRNLETLRPEIVIAGGRIAARDGEYKLDELGYQYPDWAKKTMHLRRVTPEDFELPANQQQGTVKLRVIEQMPESPFRRFKIIRAPIAQGRIDLDFSGEYNLVAVVDRHSGETGIGKGVIQGFGLQAGAVATSVSHDSHNITVLGTNTEDMAYCVNTLAEVGGGFMASMGGHNLALVRLEIAGLISGAPYEEVVGDLERFERAIHEELGFPAHMPFIAMNFIALACSPFEAGITDMGLIDARASARRVVPLIVDTDL